MHSMSCLRYAILRHLLRHLQDQDTSPGLETYYRKKRYLPNCVAGAILRDAHGNLFRLYVWGQIWPHTTTDDE